MENWSGSFANIIIIAALVALAFGFIKSKNKNTRKDDDD